MEPGVQMSKIVKVTAFLATAVSSGLIYLLVHDGATVAAQTAGSPVAPAAGAPLAAPHGRLGKAGRRADHALPQAPAPDPDQPTGSVTGRLVDARTGAALSGVQVS